MAKERSGRPSKRPATKSEGLGDDIAKITKATGIDRLVKWLAGEDCGCDERRKKLNQMFPSNKPECMTETEFQFYESIRGSDKLTYQNREALTNMYNRIFHQKNKPTTCKACIRDMITKLEVVYKTYE